MDETAIMTPQPWMQVTETTEAKAALVCARLHLRNGKRRLQKGLTAAGMTALYDAVLFGMSYYIARHKRCAVLVENIDPLDAARLFYILARTGVFEDPLTFNRFSLSVERMLWQPPVSSDTAEILAEVETMLARLGVIAIH